MLHIYVGPSLNRDVIKETLPEAVIHEPIKGGDILSLLNTEEARPSHIHIIDGYYYSVPSVRHKEIEQALAQGICVSGCASLGALRAAECRQMGMVGSGRVYEYYQATFVSGDDEVAVLHEEVYPYRMLSMPLINLRLSLQEMVAESLIGKGRMEEILEFYKNMFFADRKLNDIEKITSSKEEYKAIMSSYRDWKREDAVESIGLLRSIGEKWEKEKSVISSVSFGEGYNRLNYYKDADFSVREDGEIKRMNGDEIVEMIGSRSDYINTMYNSLNRAIAIRYARDLGIVNRPEEVARFKILQEKLLTLGERSNRVNYPASYKLYTDEVADQELCLLKLQLWYSDASGLIGTTGALIDALVAGRVEIGKGTIESEKRVTREHIDLLTGFVNELDEYGPDLVRKIYIKTGET